MTCKLRKVDDSDHIWLVDLHNDPDVLRNLTNPMPITLESHMRWWKNICNSHSEIRMIFELDGQPAGFTKFYSIDKNNHSCILGADLHKDYRGKGLAKHMWSLMIDYCFKELLLHRISLTTAEYNHIAIKVYKNLGFLEEGRLKESLFRDNKFYDQICMYMINKDV